MAYVHKIKIKPPSSESRLKNQIQIGSRFKTAFSPTFYYTMLKIAFVSSCWQCQSAERQTAFVPARSHRSTHKPACRMCIVQPFQTVPLHAALVSDQHGLTGATPLHRRHSKTHSTPRFVKLQSKEDILYLPLKSPDY